MVVAGKFLRNGLENDGGGDAFEDDPPAMTWIGFGFNRL
jgi:hypothetical protein